MLYRKMDSTGDELSILGYGCMRLPEKNGKIDKEIAKRQIFSAVDKGVNYIDTAFPYHMGESEPFIGEIIDKNLRKRLKIATKLPPYSLRTAEDMEKILNKQLIRLNIDYIDYYMLHGIEAHSWEKFKRFEVFDFMDKIKKQGKIKNIGFSFHGNFETFKEIVDAYDWQFTQIQYNYLDENYQAGTKGMEYASAKGIGVIIMEPLRGGTITGRIPDEIQTLWNKSEVKRSPAEWALRWIWDRPEINVVLSGMNKQEHIDENIKIASEANPNSLTKVEHNLINEVKEKYRKMIEINCTGCQYCMPCPAGVDIPLCFDLYNRTNFFKEGKTHNIIRYVLHTGFTDSKNNSSYASLCINCGKCVKHCPQSIRIPAELKKVARTYETLQSRFIGAIMKIFFSRARRKKA